MVCRAGQTVLQSAELGFRPGLDDALCPHGVRRVAGFAVATTNRHASGRLGAVLRPVGAECGVALVISR